jgi:LTXXQ motif family protein
MLRFTKFAPLAVAVALGTAAASLPGAYAQPATPQAQAQERPSRIEGRIAFLRTELQITDAQAPLWDAVAAVLRENDRTRRDAFARVHAARDQQPTALERLERRQKFAEQQAASTAKLRTALEPLYAAMTDEQKKNADQLLGGSRGHHGRMGHRRI